jgi:nucleoid DNA-binding protein
VNKSELIMRLAIVTGTSKAEAAKALQSILDTITKALKKGESVTLVGFGTFKAASRKARTVRNPQTGAQIKLPKRRVPRFTAGKALKQSVR